MLCDVRRLVRGNSDCECARRFSCTEISGEWNFWLLSWSQYLLTPVYSLSCWQNLCLVNTYGSRACDSPMLIRWYQAHPFFGEWHCLVCKEWQPQTKRKRFCSVFRYLHTNIVHVYKNYSFLLLRSNFLLLSLLAIRCCNGSYFCVLHSLFQQFDGTYATCSVEQNGFKCSYELILYQACNRMCLLVHLPFKS